MQKKVVKDMNDNNSTTLPITYSFFKNDTIVEKINSDLNVEEGTKKILFSNIKNWLFTIINNYNY